MNAVALQPAFKMQKNRHIRDGFSLTLGILKIKCFAILFYYVSLCFLIWNQHDQSCSDNVNYNKYNIWQCKTSSGNFQQHSHQDKCQCTHNVCQRVNDTVGRHKPISSEYGNDHRSQKVQKSSDSKSGKNTSKPYTYNVKGCDQQYQCSHIGKCKYNGNALCSEFGIQPSPEITSRDCNNRSN